MYDPWKVFCGRRAEQGSNEHARYTTVRGYNRDLACDDVGELLANVRPSEEEPEPLHIQGRDGARRGSEDEDEDEDERSGVEPDRH